jgi:hypothetical protein
VRHSEKFVLELAGHEVAVSYRRGRRMALAQTRALDAILVTELSRWGRSTQDLADPL